MLILYLLVMLVRVLFFHNASVSLEHEHHHTKRKQTELVFFFPDAGKSTIGGHVM